MAAARTALALVSDDIQGEPRPDILTDLATKGPTTVDRYKSGIRTVSGRFLSGNLGPFFASFRKAYRNRLFTAFYCSAFAAAPRFQSAAFPAPHRTGDGFPRRLSVFPTRRLLFPRHAIPPEG